MDDEGKMLLVQDAVQLLQRGVQGHLPERVVGRLDDGVAQLDFSFQDLGFQTAQRSNSFDFSENYNLKIKVFF